MAQIPVDASKLTLLLLQKNRKAVSAIAVASVVSIIATFEGFSNNAYLPHKDDVPTIGYGQTYYADGRKVQMGDYMTKEEATNQLGILVKRDFVNKIAKCVNVPLTQNEFDAYVSLAYNIGSNAFCKSTLVKKLNSGDYDGACEQIKRWNRSGGKVMKGLVKRRQQEYDLCTAPDVLTPADLMIVKN